MSYVALEDVGDTKKGDLPIRAGDMVHVLDKTNKDWWMVKRETETGFVPVQCLEKVQPWERVLRVARTYTAPEHSDQISLKRNQVVIQISNVDNGWTIVKASDKRTGRFPYQYLSPMLRRQSTVST
ncbi:SH3 and cysteine-rich domain-containing protein 3-like [Saccoglossus kowalevskii]